MWLSTRLSFRWTVVAVALVTVAAVALFAWPSEAAPLQTKAAPAPTKPAAAEVTQLSTTQLAHLTRTDLRIDGIFGGNCKCNDLADVDALYMGRIAVSVSNSYQQGGGASTASVLTVTYFDLKLGQQVTKTKALPALSPYPTNPWALQETPVVTGPVLIRKSVGIKAEIKPTTAGVSDPTLANNTMVEHDCKIMVY